MELTEAISHINGVGEAIKAIADKGKAVLAIENKFQKQLLKIAEQEAELKTLRGYKRSFEILSGASPVTICPQCDGNGGMYIDMGEQGTAAEQCGKCEGAGVIDKTLLPQPLVPLTTERTNESVTSDSDDLPF